VNQPYQRRISVLLHEEPARAITERDEPPWQDSTLVVRPGEPANISPPVFHEGNLTRHAIDLRFVGEDLERDNVAARRGYSDADFSAIVLPEPVCGFVRGFCGRALPGVSRSGAEWSTGLSAAEKYWASSRKERQGGFGVATAVVEGELRCTRQSASAPMGLLGPCARASR